MKVPYKEIRQRLLKCDPNDEKITPTILEQLIKAMPEDSEDVMESLAAFKKEHKQLVEAEQFLVTVSPEIFK